VSVRYFGKSATAKPKAKPKAKPRAPTPRELKIEAERRRKAEAKAKPKPKPKAAPKKKAPAKPKAKRKLPSELYAPYREKITTQLAELDPGAVVTFEKVKVTKDKLERTRSQKIPTGTQRWTYTGREGRHYLLEKTPGERYRAARAKLELRTGKEYDGTLLLSYLDAQGSRTTGTYVLIKSIKAPPKAKAKAKAKAKPKAKRKAPPKAKAKAKAKPKPKSRRGRYAVVASGSVETFKSSVAGTQHYAGAVKSTHRTEDAAIKAAQKLVAKRTLKELIEGKLLTAGSSMLVVHDEKNVVADVQMRMPKLQRRKMVKRMKVEGDSYSSIELGLVQYCNVDLGHRISQAKAKKRAEAGKSKAKSKAKPKRKKLTEAEKAANTRRLIAQMARGA
jgi:hypothetical protein